MKRFKELRNELISEAEFDPYGLNAKSVLTDDGVHRLENPGNIARINQFNFLEGECMNVKVKLEQLRVRLNHIGLDFNVNEGLSDDDITSYPVNYYGKAYGYHPETNEIGEYDNATAKFGRPLVFSVRKSGEGSYYLEGKIHFVGEEGIEEEEDELYGESLELRLNIDNDDELFESKIIPALESADDEERAYRGLVYAVRSAAKKYEMDVTEETVSEVVESLLNDILDELEEEPEGDDLQELKSPTLRSYVSKASGQVRSDLSTGKHSPKTNKRAKGVSAALSRLDARKQLKGAPKGSQRHSEWGKLAKDDK